MFRAPEEQNLKTPPGIKKGTPADPTPLLKNWAPLCYGVLYVYTAHIFFWSAPLSSMMLHITPEQTVPYPTSMEDEEAPTLRENMQIASNTAAVLKGMGAVFEEDPDTQAEANAVFADFAKLAEQQYEEAMAPDKPKRGPGRPPKPKIEKNPIALQRPSVAERIGTMLREYNNPFVADAAELRQVVTNKLLDLAGCGDPRIEIKATEMLGKISDVGLFSDKTEITVTYNNVADIDEAIKDKIRKMMRLHAVDVTPLGMDIDEELGLTPTRTIGVDASAGEAGLAGLVGGDELAGLVGEEGLAEGAEEAGKEKEADDADS